MFHLTLVANFCLLSGRHSLILRFKVKKAAVVGGFSLYQRHDFLLIVHGKFHSLAEKVGLETNSGGEEVESDKKICR